MSPVYSQVYFCLLVSLVISPARHDLVHGSKDCRSGRLYLGSFSDQHVALIRYTGIYQLIDRYEYNDRPVFKHTSNSAAFIYFLHGGRVGQDFWAVGPETGSNEPEISVVSNARSPQSALETWRIWNAVNSSWSLVKRFKAVCVDADFTPCTSGLVRLTGISGRHKPQQILLGIYAIANTTLNLRPVYKHVDKPYYLFYLNDFGGTWIIGPELGKSIFKIFAADYALRPEFIFQDWHVSMEPQKKVKIVCQGLSLDEREKEHPTKEENQGETQTQEKEEEAQEMEVTENLGQNHGDRAEDLELLLEESVRRRSQTSKTKGAGATVCKSFTCENGGRCRRSNDKEIGYMCICNGPFVGLRCDLAIDCGDPPVSADEQSVLSSTGHYFLDVVFYRCPDNTILDRPYGVVCGMDGRWSQPPRCLDGPHLITPMNDDGQEINEATIGSPP